MGRYVADQGKSLNFRIGVTLRDDSENTDYTLMDGVAKALRIRHMAALESGRA